MPRQIFSDDLEARLIELWSDYQKSKSGQMVKRIAREREIAEKLNAFAKESNLDIEITPLIDLNKRGQCSPSTPRHPLQPLSSVHLSLLVAIKENENQGENISPCQTNNNYYYFVFKTPAFACGFRILRLLCEAGQSCHGNCCLKSTLRHSCEITRCVLCLERPFVKSHVYLV